MRPSSAPLVAAPLVERAERDVVAVVEAEAVEATVHYLYSTVVRRGGRHDGEPGVGIRILVAPQHSDGRMVARQCADALPIRVRYTRTPVQELVIVDGRTAVIPASAKVVPTSDTAVIAALYALFDSVWELSSPVDQLRCRDSMPDLDTAVLAQLRTGHTDEVAARRIGVSVRTYRRCVARVMQAIGATSRFQAGVLASERGLVTVTASSGAEA